TVEDGSSVSHLDIGLGTGIFGSKISQKQTSPTAPANKSGSRSFRRFEKFLKDTDSDWNAEPDLISSIADLQIKEIEESNADFQDIKSKITPSESPSSPPLNPAVKLKTDEESKMMGEIAKLNTMSIRYTKFKTVLELPTIDL
ncbi:hypothetical protein HK096_001415, partial [Nowakowskiella sp. JEL0078]